MKTVVPISGVFVLLYCYFVPLDASILAKSSITQCINSNDVKTNTGQPCSKMLVVALTVTGNEVYTCIHTFYNPVHLEIIGQITVLGS